MGKQAKKTETVKVMVRVRPMNGKEKKQKCKNVLNTDKKEKTICFKDDNQTNTKVYSYDNVFIPSDTQKEVYENSAFKIVENLLEGYNGTIFAYGQTGCGKTFSMLGDINDEKNKGIIPRACSHILTRIAADKSNFQTFVINCSFIELYNEKVYDLMDKEKIKKDLKESPKKGVFVKDLRFISVASIEDILNVLIKGEKNRSVGETAMNKGSSRSHCIFTINIETSTKKGKVETVKKSKLNLVDLAGSERQSKTKAQGQRLKEANNINLSLSALGNVIAALVSKRKSHIPYRDSKLTRLLQDSLGGNTKTLMMAAVSPADYNKDETMSTLKYASRASKIKNIPKINEDPRDTLIKKYEDELKMLKSRLNKNGKIISNQINIAENGSGDDHSENLNEAKLKLQREVEKRQEFEAQIKELTEKLNQNEKTNNLQVDEQQIAYLDQVNNQLEQQQAEEEKKKKQVDPAKLSKRQKIKEIEKQLYLLSQDEQESLHKNSEEINEYMISLKQNQIQLEFFESITRIVFHQREIDYLFKNTIFLNDNDVKMPKFIFINKTEKKNLPSLKKSRNPLKTPKKPNRPLLQPLSGNKLSLKSNPKMKQTKHYSLKKPSKSFSLKKPGTDNTKLQSISRFKIK